MRSLATLGGILVLIVHAIAWKISNEVEAGQEPDKNPGRITLGVHPDDQPESDGDTKRTPASLENIGKPTGSQEPKTQPSAEPPETTPAKPATHPAKSAEPARGLRAGLRLNRRLHQRKTKSRAFGNTVKEGDTLYGILSRAYGRQTMRSSIRSPWRVT